MTQAPSDWYPDPEISGAERYWDGGQWTDERRPLPGTPSATPPASGSDVRRLRTRLADGAKQSAVAAAGAASTAGRSLASTAKDPAKRSAVILGAAPAAQAALNGAGVRNRDGKVKWWRIVTSAAQPRKTLAGVTRGVAVATAGQLQDHARAALTRQTRVAPLDEAIAAEWATGPVEQDIGVWRAGLTAFDAADVDDAVAMRASAFQMCAGLQHCVVGPPPIGEDDIFTTAGNVLSAGLRSADGMERAKWDGELDTVIRLALCVIRRLGVQPADVGGNGEMDLLFENEGDRMRMAMAMAPGRWSCDLARWFADG